MPSFNYRCADCSLTIRKLQAKPLAIQCSKCGKLMERDSNAPTSRSTEILDNPHMSRALERLDRAEEIFKDRAQTGPKTE